MSENQTPGRPDRPGRPGRPGTVRRAPRYLPFVVTGVVLGIVVAVGAVLLRSESETDVSVRAVLGYLGTIGALLGGVLGALVAVLVDRRFERLRAREQATDGAEPSR